jgi:hypothetical protein
MVQVAIAARNPTDGTTRVWGLSVDSIPTGNWLKDSNIVKTDKKTGELWNTNLQIPDGSHKIYFIISQSPGLGSYDGEALFDVAGFNFSGVDNDSIVAFDVIVKNGKASRATGVPATTGPTDLPTTNRFYTPIKSRLFMVGDKIRKVKLTWKHGVGAIILVGGTLSAIYLYKRMYKKGRRRF